MMRSKENKVNWAMTAYMAISLAFAVALSMTVAVGVFVQDAYADAKEESVATQVSAVTGSDDAEGNETLDGDLDGDGSDDGYDGDGYDGDGYDGDYDDPNADDFDIDEGYDDSDNDDGYDESDDDDFGSDGEDPDNDDGFEDDGPDYDDPDGDDLDDSDYDYDDSDYDDPDGDDLDDDKDSDFDEEYDGPEGIYGETDENDDVGGEALDYDEGEESNEDDLDDLDDSEDPDGFVYCFDGDEVGIDGVVGFDCGDAGFEGAVSCDAGGRSVMHESAEPTSAHIDSCEYEENAIMLKGGVSLSSNLDSPAEMPVPATAKGVSASSQTDEPSTNADAKAYVSSGPIWGYTWYDSSEDDGVWEDAQSYAEPTAEEVTEPASQSPFEAWKNRMRAKAAQAVFKVKLPEIAIGDVVIQGVDVNGAEGCVSVENTSKNIVAKGFAIADDGAVTVPQGTPSGFYAVDAEVSFTGGPDGESTSEAVAFIVRVA